MTGRAETRITRSWPHLFLMSGFGSGLCAGAWALFHAGHGFWGSLVALLGASIIVGGCVVGGTAPCPGCGQALSYLAFSLRFSYKRCPACGTYCEGEGGRVWLVEPGRIAQTPEFCIPLPERFIMPGMCCVCGGQASRQETVRMDVYVVNDPNTSVMAKKGLMTLDVPHCGHHTGGAKLDRELPEQKLDFETLAVGARKDPVNVLKVRSYAFYRAFREMNKA
jgi:hypothetical protein